MKKSNKKIGRNDPCWCGSGKKYKKCHYGRESMEAPNIFSLEKQLKKNFSKKYCLHPNKSECDGPIVKAHTIQRKGCGLLKISEEGHVLTFKPEMKTLIETDGNFLPGLVGIKQASTFTGFCEYHDRKPFELIENNSFVPEKKQCFLLSYRALCRELFTKKAALESGKLLHQTDKGQSINIQHQVQSCVSLNKIVLEKDLQKLSNRKKQYDKSLISDKYDNFCYYVLGLDQIPEVLCSGGFSPEFDFNGNLLQDYSNLQKDLDSFYFSLIPVKKFGTAVFGWIESDGAACSKFIKSLQSLNLENEISNALIRFIFDAFENVFFKPSWWHSLSDQAKTRIQDRVLSGTPNKKRKKDCLFDDGHRTVNWKVTSVHTNVNFT